MKLHYEKIWDADIPEESIDNIIEHCARPKYDENLTYDQRLARLNRVDVKWMADCLINEYTSYKDDYPNAFGAPLREYIREVIKNKRKNDPSYDPKNTTYNMRKVCY